MRQRIIMRLHLDMQEILEREAVWRGTKVGTLTADILHSEAEKAKKQAGPSTISGEDSFFRLLILRETLLRSEAGCLTILCRNI